MSMTNGKIATFLAAANVLFSHGFILLLLIRLGVVDLFYDLSDTGIYLLVTLDFLGRIDEQDVRTSFHRKSMFLLSPALTDSSLQKITLDCSLEHLFGNRHHDPVRRSVITGKEHKPQPGNIPVLSFGKKLSYAGLAAESFFFGKCSRRLHLISSLTGIFPMLLRQKEPLP